MLQGLNDAAAKHGFEGDGFAYLKMPLWWAGIVTCEKQGSRPLGRFPLLILHSGPRRDLQFFCLCVRAGDIGYAPRRLECSDWVRRMRWSASRIAYSADDGRAVLGAYFLKEQLGILGKLGCAICLLGSVIIVLHAPPDEEIENVGQILDDALQPGMPAI